VSSNVVGSAIAESHGAPLAAVLHGRRRGVAIAVVLVVLVTAGIAMVGFSLALFTAHANEPASFATKAVFPGERVTSAFAVSDTSGGATVDRSSPFAVDSDGLTVVTSSWSDSFASDRFLEFDFNNSLASGVAVSGASMNLQIASGGIGQACFYLEVRRISTGAVVATYGSAGSPAGCTTGPALVAFSTPIPAVATTSIANDLRVRVYGTESTDAPMVVDLATVEGSTTLQDFTLYPVVYRDAADTTIEIDPWELSVP
jgi:hypothetical protein